MPTFDIGTAGTAAITTILAEEANRIGADIHTRMLHTSPWMDLVKKSAFPEGMGYEMSTMIYDRALPTTTASDGANMEGVNWTTTGNVGGSNSFDTSQRGGVLGDTAQDFQGGRGGIGSATDDNRSFVQFSKQLKKYSLKRAVIESPRINVDDLRFAAHRQEQLRAILDLLADASKHTWENRYRDEYDRLCANIVLCDKNASSTVTDIIDATGSGTKFEGVQTAALDLVNDWVANGSSVDVKPDGRLSNELLDKLYFQLVRKGAGNNAYGRENGRPVFALVLSSEASFRITTESDSIKDDQRYNNSRVSDLIAPLGVEKSFRGFYHLIDDLAPRFNDGSNGAITRIEPYVVNSGITTVNAAYDTAKYEAAYILHPEVMESQIPNPFTGSNGVTFDPVSYTGKFDFKNIISEATNPDGTVGFFRGVLASASKPIKTDYGYVILMDRTATAASLAKA